MAIAPMISSLFRGPAAETATVPATTTQPAQNNPTVPSAATPTNTQGDTSRAAFPQTGTGEQSPLSEYQTLWDKDPAAKPPTPMTPDMKFNNQDLMAAAGKIDFSQAIPAEVRAKAMAGDSEAFMQAMGAVAQATYAQSAAAATRITEAALTRQAENLVNEHLPRMLRESNIRSVAPDVDAFSNPAINPLFESTRAQFASKYPQASASEIAAHTKQYLQQSARAILGNTVQDTPRQSPFRGRQETDWGDYFGDLGNSS